MGRMIGSLLLLSMTTAGALAQSEGSVTVGKPPPGVKMAEAECQTAWGKANPSKKEKISAGQAQPYITDLKAANSNGDASIDQSEFTAACEKGLMKKASAAGTGTGTGAGASTGTGAGTEGAGPEGAAPPTAAPPAAAPPAAAPPAGQ